MKNKITATIWIPLIAALAFAGGMWADYLVNRHEPMTDGQKKFNAILSTINSQYVDDIDTDSLIERTLPFLLNNLDPHSAYIPAKDLKGVNDDLEGSFSGVGVSFMIMNDTICIVEIISGGPAEKVGFFGWDYKNDPKSPAMQELQVRWMQWGCFMPMMRNHCSSPMVSELYNFGNPGDWAFDAQKKAIELRYRLMPYIYSLAGDVVQRSGTMMRPLVMDFPADRKAITLDDQYMFGKALLVKPVTDPLYTYLDADKNGHAIYPDITKAAAPVNVYLPEGSKWYNFWSNEVSDGGKNVQCLAPIDRMPVYVKSGSIIPFGPAVQYTTEKPWDNLELRVYPGDDGEFILYEDDGESYDYEKGMFAEIPFRWDDATRTLHIGQRNGSYPGMLNNRNFNIVIVNPDTESGDTAALKVTRTVSYDGNATSVKL